MKPIFDFITESEAKKKPYFVWYAPLLPHTPHNPPAALLAKYQDRGLSLNAAKYFAMVEWFDQTIGELDGFLKKDNRAQNTVIIYLADNGWDPEQGNRANFRRMNAASARRYLSAGRPKSNRCVTTRPSLRSWTSSPPFSRPRVKKYPSIFRVSISSIALQ